MILDFGIGGGTGGFIGDSAMEHNKRMIIFYKNMHYTGILCSQKPRSFCEQSCNLENGKKAMDLNSYRITG